jgi:hypothetical protein
MLNEGRFPQWIVKAHAIRGRGGFDVGSAADIFGT